jgi:hypothetical protein
MHMRNHLRSSCAVVLHNVVVGDSSDQGDCAGEEGEPETLASNKYGEKMGGTREGYVPISRDSTAPMSATLTLCCRVVTSKCPGCP